MGSVTLRRKVDLYIGELYGGFQDDFDAVLVDQLFREALEAAARVLVPSIRIMPDGAVVVDEDDIDAAACVEFDELINELDIVPILNAAARTA
jgi:hypothetical protein